MAKHHPDLIMCLKTKGLGVGRLCKNCKLFYNLGAGKCPICDSYSKPFFLVRICRDCFFGSLKFKCIICGGKGFSDAYYCRECVILEKDRDGCPRIINIGSSRSDLFYEKKKYEFKNAN
uniref:PHD zinc finger protein n=1 Tax=Lotharella vacuolata TaxID=74820 RepID=A0A0H5BQS1_9EUKA|nr:PHD zinc finger protein [Lotharella vacuolata]